MGALGYAQQYVSVLCDILADCAKAETPGSKLQRLGCRRREKVWT